MNLFIYRASKNDVVIKYNQYFRELFYEFKLRLLSFRFQVWNRNEKFYRKVRKGLILDCAQKNTKFAKLCGEPALETLCLSIYSIIKKTFAIFVVKFIPTITTKKRSNEKYHYSLINLIYKLKSIPDPDYVTVLVYLSKAQGFPCG